MCFIVYKKSDRIKINRWIMFILDKDLDLFIDVVIHRWVGNPKSRATKRRWTVRDRVSDEDGLCYTGWAMWAMKMN